MKITYFGHACFLLESREGKRILIDPFNDQVGYPVPRVAADLVLVSHEHFDHNSVASVDGDPDILRGLSGGDWAMVEKTVRDLSVHSIKGTYHDTEQGAK
ncbi:MAG: MBL fold metallo-hydrolase, partial [Firmicutes bacterium]|nr:MBL fold metallo-hydrolase [Bacillota bacterium]